MRDALLRAVLLALALYHLGIGALSVFAPGGARRVARALYGVSVDPTPQVVYAVRMLGLYALTLGALVALAAWRPAEHRATVVALRHTARRILALEAEANDLESEIDELVKATVPQVLDEVGVGPITRRPARRRLVAPRTATQRRRLRDARRRGADPGVLRADGPLSPQPRRRP